MIKRWYLCLLIFDLVSDSRIHSLIAASYATSKNIWPDRSDTRSFMPALSVGSMAPEVDFRFRFFFRPTLTHLDSLDSHGVGSRATRATWARPRRLGSRASLRPWLGRTSPRPWVGWTSRSLWTWLGTKPKRCWVRGCGWTASRIKDGQRFLPLLCWHPAVPSGSDGLGLQWSQFCLHTREDPLWPKDGRSHWLWA